MRKRFYAILLTLILAFSMPLSALAVGTNDTSENMRGVWVSSVYNLDYPTTATTNAATLKAQADQILNGAVAMGMNTIFLQVRPSSDALYSSKIFPWSRYLTGKQGTAPSSSFDPLAYWVQGAHARGLELHAWINPYRITKNKDTEWKSLAAKNPAKLHPTWVKKYTDGNYYYDPGIPEVRQMVIDGVKEILNKYAVDGIHLDDYFYPGTDFNDAATYKVYGKSFSNIGDWRRENVNILVRALDKAVDAKSTAIDFGISPAGIWANKSHHTLGSNTNGGYESYYRCYADSLIWIKEGCVDYIIPQIYWQIGNKSADYQALVNWWSNAVSGSSVKLYIGEAAYKCGDASQGTVWQGTSELMKHLNLCASNSAVDGNVFFRYGSLKTAPGLCAAITSYYKSANASVTGQSVKTADENQQTPTKKIGYLLSLRLFFEALIRS